MKNIINLILFQVKKFNIREVSDQVDQVIIKLHSSLISSIINDHSSNSLHILANNHRNNNNTFKVNDTTMRKSCNSNRVLPCRLRVGRLRLIITVHRRCSHISRLQVFRRRITRALMAEVPRLQSPVFQAVLQAGRSFHLCRINSTDRRRLEGHNRHQFFLQETRAVQQRLILFLTFNSNTSLRGQSLLPHYLCQRLQNQFSTLTVLSSHTTTMFQLSTREIVRQHRSTIRSFLFRPQTP